MNFKPVVSCKSIKLKIPTISSEEKEFIAPKFLVCKVPWQFKIVKTASDDKEVLSINLHCMKKHDTLAEWSYASVASFKLYNSRFDIEEPIGPFVFDQMESCLRTTTTIDWDNLLNAADDDPVNLELKVDVANPFERNRSQIILSRWSKTKIRLMVTNINNLIAVRSSPFMYRKMTFNLVVTKFMSKEGFGEHLGVLLHRRQRSHSKPLKIRMSAKLLTPMGELGIEQIHTNFLDENNDLKIEELISWKALLDGRNGFVDKNCIIMEVILL